MGFVAQASSASEALTKQFGVLGGYRTGGAASYVGSRGYYWSSTWLEADRAFSLRFSSSGVELQAYDGKYGGFAVRCVKNWEWRAVELLFLRKQRETIPNSVVHRTGLKKLKKLKELKELKGGKGSVVSGWDLSQQVSSASEAITKQFGVLGGYHTGSSVHEAGSDGYYWSSTWSGTSNAYRLYFDSSGVYPQSSYYKYYGFAVRCVKNWEWRAVELLFLRKQRETIPNSVVHRTGLKN